MVTDTTGWFGGGWKGRPVLIFPPPPIGYHSSVGYWWSVILGEMALHCIWCCGSDRLCKIWSLVTRHLFRKDERNINQLRLGPISVELHFIPESNSGLVNSSGHEDHFTSASSCRRRCCCYAFCNWQTRTWQNLKGPNIIFEEEHNTLFAAAAAVFLLVPARYRLTERAVRLPLCPRKEKKKVEKVTALHLLGFPSLAASKSIALR